MSEKLQTNVGPPRNRLMRSNRSQSFAVLGDGTPLYPAYYPLRRGERYRRQMGTWSGQMGEWVGVTWDGRLFRQTQYWGGDGPRPDGWEEFRLG